ncbi:hypothetical protein [Streptomyces sp. NPDC051554]|uniref:hypothetical protein n=1 Tax=Streptomyces sp. NPDC051554 TaxID=3365656 RepID=UPI0037BC3FC4
MSAWAWIAYTLAVAIWAVVSVTRNYRRQQVRTEQCRVQEQAKTEELMKHIAEERGPAVRGAAS